MMPVLGDVQSNQNGDTVDMGFGFDEKSISELPRIFINVSENCRVDI
jgi:hypothetical protein